MKELLHRPLPGSDRLAAIGQAKPLRLLVTGYGAGAAFTIAAILLTR